MGIHRYKKLEIASIRGICVACNERPQKNHGSGTFKPICNRCADQRNQVDRKKRGDRIYRKHKGPICENCGFVPMHSCQLDVDHVDGDHSNNDPANLRTLCACCHRLKTFLCEVPKLRKTKHLGFSVGENV